MAVNSKIAPLCFVLAPNYHGAPVLSARANLHPDILSLGMCNPLRHERQICACGEEVHDFCAFWTKAAQALGVQDDHPLPTLLPQAPYLASRATLNTWLNGIMSLIANEIGAGAWKMVYEPAERYLGLHERFLGFCREWSPHKVFLDAERSVIKCMVMASMGFPVRGIVHLVRDPRGYAAAVKRYYPEAPVEKSAMEWAAAHTRIRRLSQAYSHIPFLGLAYEDMVEKPAQTFETLFNFIGLEVFAESECPLDPLKNHILGAQASDQPQTPDEWRETLTQEEQRRVVKAAGPLFEDFGYKN